MADWKKAGKKLLFPPVWLIVIVAVISAAALAVVFMEGLDTSPIVWVSGLVYAVYVLAFYSLTVICAACALVFPGCYRKIKQMIYHTKFGNKYMTDAAYRTHFSLCVSLGINLLYVAAQLVFRYLVPFSLVHDPGSVLHNFSGDALFAASIC